MSAWFAVGLIAGGVLVVLVAFGYVMRLPPEPEYESPRDPRVPVTPLSGVKRVQPPSTPPATVSPPAAPRATLPDSLPLEGPHPARARTSSQQLAPRTISPSQGVPITETRAKPPSNPPLVARTTSPDRAKAPSTPPTIARAPSPSPAQLARAKPPSGEIELPPLDIPERAHSSSSGPIDLAARLSAATAPSRGLLDGPVAIAIRPPLPTPEPVPPDVIPVAPESGLVIRKRTPSAVVDAPNPLPSSAFPASDGAPSELADASDSMPTVAAEGLAEALAVGTPPASPQVRPTPIQFAVITAELSGSGITATREDGFHRLVEWQQIRGIVARRLPPEAPYSGMTFVDLLSSSGSTLRFLPSTQISGHPITGGPDERMRDFVNLVAAQSLEARLDAATRLFAESDGQAVQLPTPAMLASHDARVT